MLVEESLLLRTVESIHLNSCLKVKAAANRILGFIEEFIPVFKKSKVHKIFFLTILAFARGCSGLIEILSQESLDNYFVGRDGSIATLAGTIRPYVISEQMEQLVFHNFQVLREFEEQLAVFTKQDFEKSSILESVLSHFDERFSKVSRLTSKNPSVNVS